MPTNVLISNVTAISVTVSWTAPLFNGNNDLTTYVVEQVQDGVTKDNVGVGSTNVLFDGLKPFTNYTFRVKAVNKIGEGQFSVPSMVVQTSQASELVYVVISWTLEPFCFYRARRFSN